MKIVRAVALLKMPSRLLFQFPVTGPYVPVPCR